MRIFSSDLIQFKTHLNFCLLGNILVIMIVVATKTFHCVTSVLIINLAISDFLVGIGVMPFVAVSIMNNGWVNCTVSKASYSYISFINVLKPTKSYFTHMLHTF